jgi:hypothetical protein
MYEKYFVSLSQKSHDTVRDKTGGQKEIIAKGRYTESHPRVMQKYDALHLKNCGLSNKPDPHRKRRQELTN